MAARGAEENWKTFDPIGMIADPKGRKKPFTTGRARRRRVGTAAGSYRRTAVDARRINCGSILVKSLVESPAIVANTFSIAAAPINSL